MRQSRKCGINTIWASLMIAAFFCTSCGGSGSPNAQGASSWQEEFSLENRALAPTGRNPYFILEPGFRLILESATEKLVITVLHETREVDGVTARVVEEREWKHGELAEVSRNFFAIDEKTKDVFYFGEEVDIYQDGQVTSHSGAWLAGRNGARAGLIMPGRPKVGMKYYQERAGGVAMDRAEVLKLDGHLDTPAGSFTNCLLTKEGSALHPFEMEFKTYAPEVGLLQDEKLLLARYGFNLED